MEEMKPSACHKHEAYQENDVREFPVRNVYYLAADNDCGLSLDEDPTPQLQDPVFRTNIDTGQDEAIHPILHLTNSPSSNMDVRTLTDHPGRRTRLSPTASVRRATARGRARANLICRRCKEEAGSLEKRGAL